MTFDRTSPAKTPLMTCILICAPAILKLIIMERNLVSSSVDRYVGRPRFVEIVDWDIDDASTCLYLLSQGLTVDCRNFGNSLSYFLTAAATPCCNAYRATFFFVFSLYVTRLAGVDSLSVCPSSSVTQVSSFREMPGVEMFFSTIFSAAV